MKIAALILASISFPAIAAEAQDPWIADPPPSIRTAKKVTIPTSDVFEVVASMAGRTASELSKTTFISISEEQARRFTGHYYRCPPGKRPFLIRAALGFAGTGRFYVHRAADALWIVHESLGDDFVSSRTVLVVNLDFQPTATYSSVLIAQ